MTPKGLHVRRQHVDGVGPWVWIEQDEWAWQQPAEEFPELRDLILKHTTRRRCIIQAGGCLGMYPRLWSNYFQMVYTFEPEPLNFFCLSANCESDRIVKIQAALGDKPQMRAIQNGPPDNAGMHRLARNSGWMPVLRLDDFAFHSVDAIQLDCEGGEHEIIAGAQETIKRNLPVIAIEAPNDGLRQLMTDLGYVEAGQCGANPDVVFKHERITS